MMAECETLASEILQTVKAKSWRCSRCFGSSSRDGTSYMLRKENFMQHTCATERLLQDRPRRSLPRLPRQAAAAAPTTTLLAKQIYPKQSANHPYPRLPHALQKARQIRPKDGRAERTWPVLFWQCCFQEVVFERGPLGDSDLIRHFKQRLRHSPY